MKRLSAPILLVLLVAVASGCGSAESTAKAKAEQAKAEQAAAEVSGASYATPEAAYAAFKKAALAQDWGTVAGLLSEESQDMLAASMMLGASFMTMGTPEKEKSLEELFARHGMNLDDEPEEPASGPGDLVAEVKDKRAFIRDVSAWIAKHGDDEGMPLASLGELSNLETEGDHAQATADTENGPQPIEFVKSGGTWLLHLPMDGPEQGAGADEEFSSYEEAGAEAGEIAEDDAETGPRIGTLNVNGHDYALRHGLSYKSTFFDDPCTVVLLSARPVQGMQLEKLNEMLQAQGNDDAFFVRGPNLKLTFDEQGELMFVFAWADNQSINANTAADVRVEIEPQHVHGTVAMPEPEELGDTTYQFSAEFDLPLTGPEDQG